MRWIGLGIQSVDVPSRRDSRNRGVEWIIGPTRDPAECGGADKATVARIVELTIHVRRTINQRLTRAQISEDETAE